MKPHWITEAEIVANRHTHIYIYSDDKTGKAALGQAEICAGRSHCFPIWTRIWPCQDMTAHSAMWNSVPLELAKDALKHGCFMSIELAILSYPEKKVVVFPKIGQGCANLQRYNPELLKFIQEFLATLPTNK